jgi:predicted transposase YdaD
MSIKTKKQVNKVPHAHDNVVKVSMSDIDIARDLLMHHLPLDIKQRVKFETLKLEDGNFVDEELSVFHTDISWRKKL